MFRLSSVQTIKINTVSFSSIIEIGDAVRLTPKSRAFAVQRELPDFFFPEINLLSYPIFTKKLPIPKFEPINKMTINKSPTIQVNHIRILGISASSILQIGSNKEIEAEARIKHIRHLLR